MTVQKYYHIWKINLSNIFAYLSSYFISAGFMVVLMFVFVKLWTLIYSTTSVIEGFTLTMMIWYLVMSETIMFSPIFSRDISNDVKSGVIAYALNKPYNYVLYKYADFLGHVIGKNIIVFLTGAAMAMIFIGPISVNKAFIIPILISFLFAVTIHFLMTIIIGLSAFWYEDTRGLELVYHKIIFTLGGMLFPISLFPGWLEKIAAVLPFSAMSYYPAKLFVDPSIGFMKTVFMFQGVWIIVLVILAVIIYKIGVKKVNIHGG